MKKNVATGNVPPCNSLDACETDRMRLENSTAPEWMACKSLKAISDDKLHPDLEPFLEKMDEIGEVLRSPWVYSVPYHEKFNGYINSLYRSKREKISAALKVKDWTMAIILHERPYRFDAFKECATQMSDHDYWRLASEVYVDSENADQCFDGWCEIIQSTRPGRQHFMLKDEQRAYSKLPDRFQVFRGGMEGEIKDLSWTLNQRVAAWFANRFNQPGVVVTGWVKKRDVIGYLTRRGEEEIVVLPEHVSQKERFKTQGIAT